MRGKGLGQQSRLGQQSSGGLLLAMRDRCAYPTSHLPCTASQELGARRGVPAAATNHFLHGVHNKLADMMIPEVPKRTDEVAGRRRMREGYSAS